MLKFIFFITLVLSGTNLLAQPTKINGGSFNGELPAYIEPLEGTGGPLSESSIFAMRDHQVAIEADTSLSKCLGNGFINTRFNNTIEFYYYLVLNESLPNYVDVLTNGYPLFNCPFTPKPHSDIQKCISKMVMGPALLSLVTSPNFEIEFSRRYRLNPTETLKIKDYLLKFAKKHSAPKP